MNIASATRCPPFRGMSEIPRVPPERCWYMLNEPKARWYWIQTRNVVSFPMDVDLNNSEPSACPLLRRVEI